MAKIVIALGGNALGATPHEQKEAVKATAKAIVNLYQNKHQIIVVHGNGPQVGWINNVFNNNNQGPHSKLVLPFAECGAMSQGYIGYHIQNAIQNQFIKKQLGNGQAITLVSQTIVDQKDPAFKTPTKPIGRFMTAAEAKAEAKNKQWVVKEDAGRGWRRVVASPQPVALPALPVVKKLIKANIITIVGGGGGIPVVKNKALHGVAAVIDKDATAAFIASELQVDKFVILTAIEQVKTNFNTANEKALASISLSELDELVAQNQFAPGSMLPKILAAKAFVEATGQNAYIGHLQDAIAIINNEAGTKITSK